MAAERASCREERLASLRGEMLQEDRTITNFNPEM
jgi:hypothetical protein